MKTAMILAAGLGTRLAKLTEKKPKALIELNGRPIIDYVIKNLINTGINKIVINLHYYPEQITKFIESQDYPAKFFFSFEQELLDTGGAIKKAAPLLGEAESFILHNCDILTNFDLTKLFNDHQKNSSLTTLAVSKCKSNRFLWFDKDMQLLGWENQNNNLKQIETSEKELLPFDYNCIAVFNNKIFNYCQQLEQKFGLFELLLLAVRNQEIVKGFDIQDSFWIDIGTPSDLERASNYFNSKDKSLK